MTALRRTPLLFLRNLAARARYGYIGVDLGSREIKLAQLVRTNGQPQLAHVSRLSVPETATYTTESLSTGWLEETLKPALLYGGGFHGHAAAAILSMSVTELRSIEVPPGTREERRAMISHELQESKTTLDLVEFDFWDVDGAASDSTLQTANVLSISSTVAELIAEQMHAAGLHCRFLDGGPTALARSALLDATLASATEPIGLLDFGSSTVQMVVAHKGMPVFARLLKGCGIGPLVRQVGQKLGLSNEDASNLVTAVGVSRPQHDADIDADLQTMIGEMAGETIRHLSTEVQKTLGFLRLQRAECVPNVIVLTGGGAAIRNISEVLSADIGLPVSRWTSRRSSPSVIKSIAHGLGADDTEELYALAASLSALEWEP